MKYYIIEGTPDGEYNAQSKARNDANKILQKSGYKPFIIPTKYGVQEKIYLKYKQYFSYKKNYKIWKEEISKLNKGDMIVIQYPLINTMLNFQNMMDYCNELGIITVILIHDLDSIRMSNMPRKIIEDRNVLNKAKYIIAHNQKMKDYLVNNLGNEAEKIFLLKIFDYLIDKSINDKNTNKNDPVVIAGNLSPEKAKYILDLKDIENIDFNLYGKGYTSNENIKNIFYKGAFLPEDVSDETDKTNPNYDFVKKYISDEYTIEEKIINLCDLMCTTKTLTVEKRMIDLLLRHGAFKNTHYHIEETMKLKEYFDNLLGYNLYNIFPEITKNL